MKNVKQMYVKVVSKIKVARSNSSSSREEFYKFVDLDIIEKRRINKLLSMSRELFKMLKTNDILRNFLIQLFLFSLMYGSLMYGCTNINHIYASLDYKFHIIIAFKFGEVHPQLAISDDTYVHRLRVFMNKLSKLS